MQKVRAVLWGIVGVAVLVFIFLSLPQKKEENEVIIPVAGFNKGTPFTLTDHTGQPFNSTEKIKEGHYALLFFGFTHCPSICPTELQKISAILNKLPATTAEKITPLFMTIDPERDTVEALNSYVPLFHPRIIGLTGKQEQVETVLKQWKVYYNKVDDPALSDYTMDHSTYSYLIDHNMTILALFRLNNTSDQMTKAISGIIQ